MNANIKKNNVTSLNQLKRILSKNFKKEILMDMRDIKK